MLTRAGVPVELVATKSDEKDHSRWSHVFLQVVLENGQRYTLDCSHGEYPGWEVPRQYARVVYNLNGKEINPPMPIPINRRGLSAGGDTSEQDYGAYTYDQEPWTSEPYYGGDGAPQNMPSSAGGGSGWSSLIANLASTWGTTGAAIAQQKIAPLNVGEYIVNADGSIRARQVPGAIPQGLAISSGSLSPMALLGIAAVVAGVFIFGGKRH